MKISLQFLLLFCTLFILQSTYAQFHIESVVVVDPDYCVEDNGSITVTAVDPGYGYVDCEVSDDGGLNWQFAPNGVFTFEDRYETDYTIMARDQGGQVVAYANNPVRPTLKSFVPTVIDTIIGDNVNGTIIFQVSGDGGLNYSINGGSSWNYSSNVISVSNGTYAAANLLVRNGCGDITASTYDVSVTTIVDIPDSAFKAALVDNHSINTNFDNEIQYSEAYNFTGRISVGSLDISDLTGIEAFVNVTELHCNNNQLQTLNVSKNTLLTSIYCSENQLSSLDLSNNTLLSSLACNDNELTSLDLTGLTTLTGVTCHNNQLTMLNFSNNTHLTYLRCYSNQLDSLNISGCTTLNELQCQVNQLLRLNLSDNTALTELRCTNNQFSALDVSNNLLLEKLSCSYNQLTRLNVSNNTVLNNVGCSSNQLTSLDVSNNTLLEQLYCIENQITELDISTNTLLRVLNARDNNLQSLDLRNGNNVNFTLMRGQSNPNLLCVNVDDADWAQVNWHDEFDETVAFSNDCSSMEIYTLTFEITNNSTPLENAWVYFRGDTTYTNASGQISYTVVPGYYNYSTGRTNYAGQIGTVQISDSDTTVTISLDPDYDVYIPDANFKSYLLGISQINTNGDDEIQATEARSYSGSLGPWHSNISDLTGIDEFIQITELSCHYNQLTTLDVSNNTKLTELSCGSNQLDTLDVSNNPLLTLLGCSGNQISSLDLSNNTQLEYLDISSNLLTTIYISTNLLLEDFLCSGNDFDSIDVSLNTNLTRLWCYSNELTSLDVSNNNQLTALRCNSNALTTLDISSNSNLTELHCNNNNLTTLDVTANNQLEELKCEFNALTTLDVSSNNQLITLSCKYNQLKSLDVRNSNNANIISFDARQNDSLNCVSVSDVPYAQENWTLIPSGTIFHNNCGCLKTLTFTVKDSINRPIQGATVTSDSTDYVTNSNGQVIIINVAPDSHNYTISKTSYITQEGTVNVADNDVEVSITLLKEPLVEFNDARFENSVLQHNLNYGKLVDQNGDYKIQVWEAEAFNDTLYLAYRSIVDLTGIEAFTNIIGLDCSNNNLTNVDVSQNQQLTYLNCSGNEITSFDLSFNTQLINFNISENSLANLDLRNENNSNMTVSATENPNLSCVSVDDVAYAETNWSDDFDEGVAFSIDCGTLYTVTFNITDGANSLENATVNFDGSDYLSDATGTVEITDIVNGSYNYTVTKNGYITVEDSLLVWDTNVTENTTLTAYILGGVVLVVTDGTLQFGEEISVNISGLTGNIPEDSLLYQWYADDQIPDARIGADSASFVIEQADLNRHFFCVVSNTINNDNVESDNSEVAAKADQDAPAAPSLDTKTYNTVTLVEEADCEYAVDYGSWQTSLEFTGLTPETAYDFTQYYPATTTHNASLASEVLSVTTDADPGTGTPDNVAIDGEVYGSTSDQCFGAIQSIVIAENDVVTFETGSTTNFVAGESIRFLPGVSIEVGAYVHAYITTDDTYCDVAGDALPTEVADMDKSIEINEPQCNQLIQPELKVYPNPNDGRFTVQVSGLDEPTEIVIYSISGSMIYRGNINQSESFDLSVQNRGIYFVKTLNNQQPMVQKVIVQ